VGERGGIGLECQPLQERGAKKVERRANQQATRLQLVVAEEGHSFHTKPKSAVKNAPPLAARKRYVIMGPLVRLVKRQAKGFPAMPAEPTRDDGLDPARFYELKYLAYRWDITTKQLEQNLEKLNCRIFDAGKGNKLVRLGDCLGDRNGPPDSD